MNPNVGINIKCHSNCVEWCPRRCEVRVCCADVSTGTPSPTDSPEKSLSEETAEKVAALAERAIAENKQRNQHAATKSKCCTIL